MKPITRYEAEDGRILKSEDECLKYEAMLASCKKAHALLRTAIDDECKFANGYGYVQQSERAVFAFDSATVLILKEFVSEETAEMYAKNPRGIVGRYLSDGGGPFVDLAYKLWTRRFCIDDKLREWGQPYYAGAGGPDVWKTREMPGEWPSIKEPETT